MSDIDGPNMEDDVYFDTFTCDSILEYKNCVQEKNVQKKCKSRNEEDDCVKNKVDSYQYEEDDCVKAENDDKNNDDGNTKSIKYYDNNDRVNRINEEETLTAKDEEGQIMQMNKIDGKNDENDEMVKKDLMSEGSLNKGLLDECNLKPQPNITSSTSLRPDSTSLRSDSSRLGPDSSSLRPDGEADTLTFTEEVPVMIRKIESNVSVKTDMTEKIDSVSVYSSQDFSQISDYSDEDVGNIRASFSTLDIGEDIGDKIEHHRKENNEAIGNDRTIERNSGKGSISFSRQVIGEHIGDTCNPIEDIERNGKQANAKDITIERNSAGKASSVVGGERNSQQNFERNSLTKIRSDDFQSTNSRIHGLYQKEETKKCGIRVLQPPGGFSRGLW